MVNATIDNEPISIVLDGESTTVPSGETWKVTITANDVSGNGAVVTINGTNIMHLDSGGSRTSQTVLNAGDTIEKTSGYGGFHIGGWVVA